MTSVVKIDSRAFGRGVDEVLTLRPVRRYILGALNAGEAVASGRPSKSAKVSRSELMVSSYDKTSKAKHK